MHLFGRANWWLPRWLDRILPQVAIEGAPQRPPVIQTPPKAEVKVKVWKPKSMITAYLWWTFLGLFGAHQFYLGNKLRGHLYLWTLGLCGFGWLLDLFTLPRQLHRVNAQPRVLGLKAYPDKMDTAGAPDVDHSLYLNR